MRRVVALAAVLGAFAIAGTAQAASWQVSAGEQAPPPKGTPKGATLNAFFPSRLMITAGDSVTFSSASFHTVTFLGGKPPAALFTPDPAKGTYSGINDAAGSPFYFNGMPKRAALSISSSRHLRVVLMRCPQPGVTAILYAVPGRGVRPCAFLVITSGRRDSNQ